MGIKELYNDNVRKLPNEYGDVSVMQCSARKDLKFKRNCHLRYWPTVVLMDWKRLIYSERIAAENKHLERENKQIIPSRLEFMTGRFYIVILFTKRFHGSADFAFQTRSQRIKGLWVVTRTFHLWKMTYLTFNWHYSAMCWNFLMRFSTKRSALTALSA